MERQFAGRILFQQIEHRFAFCQHVRAILFRGRVAVADIGEQLWLGDGTARVFRHDLDLLAGRDLLQLDELGQQSPDRHGIVDRQLRAAAFGDVQPDLVGRQKAETACDGIDQRGIVARNHAEMVADAIGDAGWQLHLDVPGRAVGGVGAALVLQLGIIQHLHRRDAALRNDGMNGGWRHRLDRIERRVVGAAGKAGIDAQFLHRRRRGLCEPFFELAVEIAARIALAAG